MSLSFSFRKKNVFFNFAIAALNLTQAIHCLLTACRVVVAKCQTETDFFATTTL